MASKWEIVYYTSISGRSSVYEFIYDQSPDNRSKILELVDTLRERGNLVRMPYAKNLDNNLYELRVRGKQEIRILYGFLGKKILILHGFIKKTQKTPGKEMKLAKKRLSEYI